MRWLDGKKVRLNCVCVWEKNFYFAHNASLIASILSRPKIDAHYISIDWSVILFYAALLCVPIQLDNIIRANSESGYCNYFTACYDSTTDRKNKLTKKWKCYCKLSSTFSFHFSHFFKKKFLTEITYFIKLMHIFSLLL